MEWYHLTEHGPWNYTPLVEASDAAVIPELGVTLTVAEVYEEAEARRMRPMEH